MRLTSQQRQQGLALLVFIIVIALASISFFISGFSPEQIDLDRQEKTSQALQQTKAALLAYAMNYPDIAAQQAPPVFDQGPGKLPCPDTDNDGDSDLGCNAGIDNPGRVPFLNLGMEAPRDGSNELLWYAVSQNFGTAGVNTINTSSTGSITVKDSAGNILNDGAGPDGVIAVIISPGNALAREDGVVQVRNLPADQLDPLNYLDIAFFNTADEDDNIEFQNGSSNNGLVSGVVRDALGNVVVNDVIETITWQDLFDYVHARVASDLFDAIRQYRDPAACNTWPQAMLFDPTLADGEMGDDNPPGEDPLSLQGILRVDDTDWQAGGCADGLLPAWFTAEEWHRNMYYALIGAADCAAPACLSTDIGVTQDKQVVLVFAGRHGLVAPSINPADYFEGENDNTAVDSVFDASQPADSVWGITP